MSKSILVIDTPENCCGCDLEYGHYCGKEKRYIDEEEFGTIPDWCPLRDLPERMKYNNIIPISKQHSVDCMNGHNACIDEVLKGADGNDEGTV